MAGHNDGMNDPRTPEDDLRESMAAHKAGRFVEADAGYRRVLAARPADPKALYYLGLLSFHRGDTNAAIELVNRCVTIAPSNAHAWNTLGGLYIAASRNAEAREAYRRVTAIAPTMGEGWYNLGICLRDEGNVDGAVEALRASVAHEPNYFRAYEALAMLLYQLGKMPESADVYREWAARDPQNPKARHMAAATSQQDVPARAAEEYVRALFDSSARSFDADLEKLGYRAPGLVAAALTEAVGSRVLPNVLDAGCGTGLCGPLIRAKCGVLVGADLSAQMIERARSRDCYDDLVVADLVEFMRSRPSSFDAVLSADTLVYFGSLEAPFSAAREALRPEGILVFTLESLPMGNDDEYRLEAHGRFAHSESYVSRCLTESGFSPVTISRETLREERSKNVDGFLVVAYPR
jgi:predicted TPR repeat methyltransferase